MTERRSVSSGAKWESMAGYSRAVRIGSVICVSGTVGISQDGSVPSDAYGQAKTALETIGRALEELGAELGDVVRTRMFVTDIGTFDEVARAHGEAFGAIRPATTIVEVRRLVDPAYVVEIEADAVI